MVRMGARGERNRRWRGRNESRGVAGARSARGGLGQPRRGARGRIMKKVGRVPPSGNPSGGVGDDASARGDGATAWSAGCGVSVSRRGARGKSRARVATFASAASRRSAGGEMEGKIKCIPPGGVGRRGAPLRLAPAREDVADGLAFLLRVERGARGGGHVVRRERARRLETRFAYFFKSDTRFAARFPEPAGVSGVDAPRALRPSLATGFDARRVPNVARTVSRDALCAETREDATGARGVGPALEPAGSPFWARRASNLQTKCSHATLRLPHTKIFPPNQDAVLQTLGNA